MPVDGSVISLRDRSFALTVLLVASNASRNRLMADTTTRPSYHTAYLARQACAPCLARNPAAVPNSLSMTAVERFLRFLCVLSLCNFISTIFTINSTHYSTPRPSRLQLPKIEFLMSFCILCLLYLPGKLKTANTRLILRKRGFLCRRNKRTGQHLFINPSVHVSQGISWIMKLEK